MIFAVGFLKSVRDGQVRVCYGSRGSDSGNLEIFACLFPALLPIRHPVTIVVIRGTSPEVGLEPEIFSNILNAIGPVGRHVSFLLVEYEVDIRAGYMNVRSVFFHGQRFFGGRTEHVCRGVIR